MKKVMIGGLVSAVVVGSAAALALINAGAVPPEPKDIGVLLPEEVTINAPTNHDPKVSQDEAVGIVRQLLAQNFHISESESAVTKAALGTFTGAARGRTGIEDRQVQNVSAWFIVVALPQQGRFQPSSGPVYGPGVNPPQFNAAVDATTGELLYGIIAGKVKER